MDQDTKTHSAEDSVWPEFTAEQALTRSALTLDTHRSSADGRLLEVSSQLDLVRTRLSSLEQHVLDSPLPTSIEDNQSDRLRSLEETTSRTGARFDALATRVAEAEEHIAATMMASVDGFDTRLALIEDSRLAQADELGELTGYLEQAFTRVTELAEVIEAHRATSSEALAEVEDRVGATQVRASISALESTVSDLQERTEQAGSDVDSRVQEMQFAATAPLAELEARIDAQSDKLIEQGQRIREMGQRVSDTESQIEENRLGLQSQQERLDLHATELGQQLDELHKHDETLTTHESSIAELHSRLDDVDAGPSVDNKQFVAQSNQIKAANTTAERAAQLTRNNAERISSIASTSELLGQRIDLVEAAAEDVSLKASNATTEISDATDAIARIDGDVVAMGEKVESSAHSIEAAHGRIDELEAAQSGDISADIDEKISSTNARLEDMETTTHELGASLKAENSELRSETSELRATVETLAASALDATSADSKSVDAAQATADEAHSLAEGLRQIQAQVVQTIKGELTIHDGRLSGLESSQESANAQLASFTDTQSEQASSERVHQLETKLVEALQTISQLTQLQRRHTTVETQITDTLTATTQGVEHTQQHVVALRGQLEEANARIQRLEGALSAISGQPLAATSPVQTSPLQNVETESVADSLEADSATDADSDTGWFTESYERRNAS